MDALEPIVLADPEGQLEATFLPGLGMVCRSLRHRGEELLAQRGGPEAYAERGSSFGIPLLHPWANRLSGFDYPGPSGPVELDRASPVLHLDGDTGLPMHGLLAASPLWEITRREPTVLVAELDFSADERLLAAFPYPHRLRYEATVAGDALTIEFTVVPTAPIAVPIAFGFHPYLSLPDSDRESWTITLPVRRQALLDGGLPTGETQPIAPGTFDGRLGARAFDDSFDSLSRPEVFRVADATRTVTVTFNDGFHATQVYAPAGSSFICFEPMTAPVDALRSGHGLRHAQPGSEYGAAFTIAVE